MAGATLAVVLEPHPDDYGANGRETVELRVAPNPGIEAAPLRDAASGGELSRVMLALSGLGQAATAGTLVFDEIDAGIGGSTARVVGERLKALGKGRQVVCITHLPQVASLADVHFRLEKDVADGQSFASVERLGGGGGRRPAACAAGRAPPRLPPATPASCSPRLEGFPRPHPPGVGRGTLDE